MATPVLLTSVLKYRWRCLDSNYCEAKHVSSATTLLRQAGEDYVTGKTPKKLVQVVQELQAIYTSIALAGKPPGTRRI